LVGFCGERGRRGTPNTKFGEATKSPNSAGNRSGGVVLALHITEREEGRQTEPPKKKFEIFPTGGGGG